MNWFIFHQFFYTSGVNNVIVTQGDNLKNVRDLKR